jgi:hypothetical protein
VADDLDEVNGHAPEIPVPGVDVDPPKRRRGRPKGSPKVPGSGRKKETPNWSAAEVRNQLLRIDGIGELKRIIEGRPIRVSGSTGKPYDAYPTIDQRIRGLEIWAKKLAPDLQSQAVTGADNGPVVVQEMATDRQLARAILGIFHGAVNEAPSSSDSALANAVRTAGVGASQPAGVTSPAGTPAPWQGGLWERRPVATGEDEPPEEGPTSLLYIPADLDGPGPQPDWKTAPYSDAEVVRPDARPPKGMAAAPPPPAPSKFEVGERILLGERGHAIEHIQTGNDGRTKWWILNANGHRVSAVWGEDAARAAVDQLIRTGKVTK